MLQVVLNPTCYLAQVPKANMTTGRTSQCIHIGDENKIANFACTVPGSGSTFTRGFFDLIKVIYDHILKNKHINDIGLDVAQGLRDNMIVNDIIMNSYIVISYRLNVRDVGNSLRGWMR